MLDKFRVTAPCRADLAGGTLDLWPLYCLVPGAQTINIALDLFAAAEFEIYQSKNFQVELKTNQDSCQLLDIKTVADFKAIPPSLKFPAFVTNQFFLSQGKFPPVSVTIRFNSAVPVGSGLGGSSTLLIALGRGLSRVCQSYHEQGWQWRFLDWAKDTEAAFLRVPTGTQDYLAAIFGGLHGYQFQSGKIRQTFFEASVFNELKKRLIVIFSGEKHHSGLSNWDLYKKAVDGDEAVLSGLNQISSISQSLDQSFRSEQISWGSIGKLLEEEWKVRKSTFRVSTPHLDQAVEQVKRTGVLGVKVCGAAQGGSFIALVEPDQKKSIVEKLLKSNLQVLATEPTQNGVSIHDNSLDMD